MLLRANIEMKTRLAFVIFLLFNTSNMQGITLFFISGLSSTGGPRTLITYSRGTSSISRMPSDPRPQLPSSTFTSNTLSAER